MVVRPLLFSWDTQNRLIGLTRSGATTLTAAFKYDLGNRRIEKTINGETVKFIYDGDQIVGEQKSDNTTTSVLAGLAIDEMIARYSNGQQSTYLTDALGSVIAQLKDDQSVQNQYGYSPYGVTVKGNAGVVDNPVDDKGNASQYTGRENDGTGLYYYRARYYMASCGRFISEDPIGLGGGQTNLYAYVGGDPVDFMDPSGLDFQSGARCFVKGAGIGAAGALVVGVIAVGAVTIGAPVAGVTLVLGLGAAAGAGVLGWNIAKDWNNRNWDGLAYDLGSMVGGFGAGAASGRAVARGINGVSSGPFRFNDSFQNYNPKLGTVKEWLGTGPNVGSAAATTGATGAGGAGLLTSPGGC